MAEQDTPQAPVSPQAATILNAGWRPYSGWVVCVAGVAYALILHPLLNWAMQFVALMTARPIPSVPQLDTTLLLELFLILVGYRTIEKVKEVAAK